MEKTKKECTTKLLKIPAGTLMEVIADDNETKYPVEICILWHGGGAYNQAMSGEQLLEMAHARQIGWNYVTRIRKDGGRRSIEMSAGASFSVEKSFMPNKVHNDVLSPEEVKTFYQLVG